LENSVKRIGFWQHYHTQLRQGLEVTSIPFWFWVLYLVFILPIWLMLQNFCFQVLIDYASSKRESLVFKF
jgi:hypothetical protein